MGTVRGTSRRAHPTQSWGPAAPSRPRLPPIPAQGGETERDVRSIARCRCPSWSHRDVASIWLGWATGKGPVGAWGSSLDPEDFKEQV